MQRDNRQGPLSGSVGLCVREDERAKESFKLTFKAAS